MKKIVNNTSRTIYIQSLDKILSAGSAVLIEEYELYDDIVRLARKGTLKIINL